MDQIFSDHRTSHIGKGRSRMQSRPKMFLNPDLDIIELQPSSACHKEGIAETFRLPNLRKNDGIITILIHPHYGIERIIKRFKARRVSPLLATCRLRTSTCYSVPVFQFARLRLACAVRRFRYSCKTRAKQTADIPTQWVYLSSSGIAILTASEPSPRRAGHKLTTT